MRWEVCWTNGETPDGDGWEPFAATVHLRTPEWGNPVEDFPPYAVETVFWRRPEEETA